MCKIEVSTTNSCDSLDLNGQEANHNQSEAIITKSGSVHFSEYKNEPYKILIVGKTANSEQKMSLHSLLQKLIKEKNLTNFDKIDIDVAGINSNVFKANLIFNNFQVKKTLIKIKQKK